MSLKSSIALANVDVIQVIEKKRRRGENVSHGQTGAGWVYAGRSGFGDARELGALWKVA